MCKTESCYMCCNVLSATLGSLRTNDGDCNGNAIRGHGVPVSGLDERALRGNLRERQLRNGRNLKRGLVNEIEPGKAGLIYRFQCKTTHSLSRLKLKYAEV